MLWGGMSSIDGMLVKIKVVQNSIHNKWIYTYIHTSVWNTYYSGCLSPYNLEERPNYKKACGVPWIGIGQCFITWLWNVDMTKQSKSKHSQYFYTELYSFKKKF